MSAPVVEPTQTEPPADAPPGRWRGPIMPVNTNSGDRRLMVLVGDDVPQRPLPLPLSAQYKLDNGHNGSIVVGLIERLWLQDSAVWAEGSFDLADPVATDWARKVGRGVAGWISADLSDIAMTEVPLGPDGRDVTAAYDEWMLTGGPGSPSPAASWLYRIDEWKLMGATLVSSPAFEQARIEPVWEDAAAITAAGDEQTTHTGAMIALVPAPEDAARLAVDGGEPVEELHLTLAYLGEATDWSPEQIDSVHTAVADLLSGPVLGEVWAHASFNPGSSDDGKDPCAVYLAGGEGLAELHAAAVAAARETGGPVPEQHSPWIPHITAGYGMDVGLLTETGPIRFDRLRVAFAGRATDIPLESVTAALTAAAVTYDRADFMLPEPDELTAITVTEDGQVFGHLAEYGSCHIGFADVCVTPPTSASDYAYFHQGEVATDAGPLAVGKITLGTGHASMRASARAAAEHYDNTGTAVAVVRCRDGALGPWLSGRILPGVTDERVDELRRSGISGDWRGIRRGSRTLELVGVLAVNVPGFPVPRTRALAASGVRSLVAAAVPRRTPGPSRPTLAAMLRAARQRAADARIRPARLQAAIRRVERCGDRYVRTPDGEDKYGKPIGSPIKGGKPKVHLPDNTEKPGKPKVHLPDNTDKGEPKDADDGGPSPAPETPETGERGRHPSQDMPTITDLFENGGDDLTEQIGAGLDGEYGRPLPDGSRLRMRVTQADHEVDPETGAHYTEFTAEVTDGQGRNVGMVTRVWEVHPDGTVTVENVLLELDESVRGHGFSTDLWATFDDYYHRSGVQSVSLYASLENGGYAWARAGFDWDTGPGHEESNRRSILGRLNMVHDAETTTPDEQAVLSELRERFAGPMDRWPTPNELSRLPGGEPRLGRRVMEGSSWYGIRLL